MKKRCIALILTVLMFIGGVPAFAESCPLPEPNTDVEIKFPGIEWYTDYIDTLVEAEKKGINVYDKYTCFFEDYEKRTPHWPVLFDEGHWGSEKGCGGFILFSRDRQVPDLAGYKVYCLDLYLMYDQNVGRAADFKQPGAVQFYLGQYLFWNKDLNIQVAYEELLLKLKNIYGDNPETGYSEDHECDYAIWVNKEGALVGLSKNEYFMYLTYMAPGAEERLCQLEEKIEADVIAAVKDFESRNQL